MKCWLAASCLALASVLASAEASAQQLVESYEARLGPGDHFNSNGQRLGSAAAIIRQDRANFHRFNRRDPEDEGDQFFADEGNRAALERMLERGRSSPSAISRVVNGTPLVRVDIFREQGSVSINVAILD